MFHVQSKLKGSKKWSKEWNFSSEMRAAKFLLKEKGRLGASHSFRLVQRRCYEEIICRHNQSPGFFKF